MMGALEKISGESNDVFGLIGNMPKDILDIQKDIPEDKNILQSMDIHTLEKRYGLYSDRLLQQYQTISDQNQILEQKTAVIKELISRYAQLDKNGTLTQQQKLRYIELTTQLKINHAFN